jgi:hypothetical protein
MLASGVRGPANITLGDANALGVAVDRLLRLGKVIKRDESRAPGWFL